MIARNLCNCFGIFAKKVELRAIAVKDDLEEDIQINLPKKMIGDADLMVLEVGESCLKRGKNFEVQELLLAEGTYKKPRV
ncbi:MAG: hypothetical protein P4M14_05010 [Gammaproteobacteria bacterium]|nr:hypothetical protein [Gammaproteobacteria bacterium]